MATQEQVLAYRHKKYSQRKRSRDDDDETITFSTDSDSSLEPDQENYTSNVPKQRKVHHTNSTAKEKFKTEKAINELRIRIQMIDLNANEPEIIDLTKDGSSSDEATVPSSTFKAPTSTATSTDSNGNILKNSFAKRGRAQVSVKNSEKESLSDDEINEKLIKLDIPLPMGPPPNRRVTFGGFAQFPQHEPSPRKTKLSTFEGHERAAKIQRNTENSDMERIKFSSKKMGRSKTIKEINVEDEWKIYKTANLSLSEIAKRTSLFGMK